MRYFTLSLLFHHRNNEIIGIQYGDVDTLRIKGYTDNDMFKVLVAAVC